MNLTGLTIDSARSAIADRKTSAAALAEEFYAKIESDDPKIGAYLILSKARALAKAAQIDGLAEKGQDLPPLAGVPVAIKDVMVTKDVRTTAGSKILGNYVPPYDCTAVARLEAAGAVVLGKLN
jgi:aspartyl-tRNA(Asn)/glutamyl-tRNA(Gln) amidotransferase subunit A